MPGVHGPPPCHSAPREQGSLRGHMDFQDLWTMVPSHANVKTGLIQGWACATERETAVKSLSLRYFYQRDSLSSNPGQVEGHIFLTRSGWLRKLPLTTALRRKMSVFLTEDSLSFPNGGARNWSVMSNLQLWKDMQTFTPFSVGSL